MLTANQTPQYQNNNRNIKKVGNYSFETQKFLGSGSYSTVYLGQNDQTSEPVAIKVINRQSITDNYMYETLKSEVNILKNLNHQNIVKLYDVLDTVNNIYIITEYCNGGTLDELLKKHKRFTEEDALFIMKDLLSGFKEILKHNIVHRDIKPANIFIHEGRFKIGDFGFAKRVDDLDEKLMKSIVGTPLYMSPECLENKYYSSKNDVYSLGIIMYKLLYGRTPWPSCTRNELINNMYLSPLIIPNDSAISKQTTDFLIQALQYRELERINWNEIYDCSLFKESSVDEKNVQVEPESKKKDEEDTAMKNEEVEIIENKENVASRNTCENKGVIDKIISSHIKTIQRIDSLVTNVFQRNLFSVDCSRLGVLLLDVSNFHIKDLTLRINKIKENSACKPELMNGIESQLKGLELRNIRHFKHFRKIAKKEDIYEDSEDNSEKTIYERVIDQMKPIIREINHKIFEKSLKNTSKEKSEEKRILFEILKEMLLVYQTATKMTRVNNEKDFGDFVKKMDSAGNTFFEELVSEDYQYIRKLIYELAI